jgi:hypothetical protein
MKNTHLFSLIKKHNMMQKIIKYQVKINLIKKNKFSRTQTGGNPQIDILNKQIDDLKNENIKIINELCKPERKTIDQYKELLDETAIGLERVISYIDLLHKESINKQNMSILTEQLNTIKNVIKKYND